MPMESTKPMIFLVQALLKKVNLRIEFVESTDIGHSRVIIFCKWEARFFHSSKLEVNKESSFLFF